MRMQSWMLVAIALLGATRESGAQFLSVSGSPSVLRVQSATPGGTPAPATNGSTTYTIDTDNNKNQKIVGRINANMPDGVTLTVTLQAPGGAISVGAVMLTTTSKDLVTSIEKNTLTTRSITYEVSATLQAGVVASQSRTVTMTVITGT